MPRILHTDALLDEMATAYANLIYEMRWTDAPPPEDVARLLLNIVLDFDDEE